MHRTRIALMVALALASDRVAAQAGPMTGRPTSLEPAATSSVTLHALSADFRFDPEAEAFRVISRYELHNSTPREVRLQLGLPEARCDSDDEEDTTCTDPTSLRFESLETLVRGAAVPLRKGRIAPRHEWASELAGVWVFEVRLRPDERVPIEHRFEVPGAPAAGSGMTVKFVARTSRLWADSVDRATFTFSIPAYSCLVVEPEHLPRRDRRVVLRDQEPWLQLTYAAQRWTPRSDPGLYFETCIMPRDTELSGCSLLDALARYAYPRVPTDPRPAPSREELHAQLAKLPQAELERCGSAVFDAYASYYDAAELTVLAGRPSAARHFTAPLLTPADWQWVALVDAVRAERSRNRARERAAAESGHCSAGPAAPASPGLAWVLAAALLAITSRRLRARPRAWDNRTESPTGRVHAAGRSRPRAAAPGPTRRRSS